MTIIEDRFSSYYNKENETLLESNLERLNLARIPHFPIAGTENCNKNNDDDHDDGNNVLGDSEDELSFLSYYIKYIFKQ